MGIKTSCDQNKLFLLQSHKKYFRVPEALMIMKTCTYFREIQQKQYSFKGKCLTTFLYFLYFESSLNLLLPIFFKGLFVWRNFLKPINSVLL